jgi:fructose-bisphosphate aldolase class II
MVWGTAKKHLDVGLIARIKSSVGIPLTLHGGSGTDDADLQNAIAAGINIIHINTEVRVAWRQGLEEGLAQDLYQVVPYKILPFAVESTKRVVRSWLQLFDGWPVEFGGKPNVERVA